MAHRIRNTTILVPGSGGPSARARARDDIDRLLLAANHPEYLSRQIANELDHGLTLLSTGVPIHPPRDWPLRPAIAFDNLARYVESGYHLRRCRECGSWFVANDRRRQLCHRPQCVKRAARTRAAMSRRHEREKQRRARVTLKAPFSAK